MQRNKIMMLKMEDGGDMSLLIALESKGLGSSSNLALPSSD